MGNMYGGQKNLYHPLVFHGWTNSNWIGDLNTCYPTLRYAFMFIEGLISRQSHKQSKIFFPQVRLNTLLDFNYNQKISMVMPTLE
jgi:hypothetical protein